MTHFFVDVIFEIDILEDLAKKRQAARSQLPDYDLCGNNPPGNLCGSSKLGMGFGPATR